MTGDNQMGPILRLWLKDTTVTPPDAQHSVSQVVGRLPEVSKQRRWWPLRTKTTPPAPAMRDNDYQPTPVPATNGQSATVTGRTQSMFSPAKAITAGALVFALGGVLLIAQPFDQRSSVPGAATDTMDPCTAPITAVSGTIHWGTTSDEEPAVLVDGVTHSKVIHLSRWDMDDDRLDGDQEFHALWDTNGTAGVNGGTIRIVNADGAWNGTVHGVGLLMGSWQQFTSLTGEGL